MSRIAPESTGDAGADDCSLCDLPTPDVPVTGEGVAGTFCCRGCLEVARTLDDVESTDPADLDPAPDTEDAEGETAYLQVDGMHCATCEAFLEGVATDGAGVEAADASYAAGLIKVVYDPAEVEEAALPGLVDGLGYRAHLADEPASDEQAQVGRLLVGGFFGMMTMLWYVLFLYPAYLGLPADLLLLDVDGPAGRYLLANAWVLTTVVLGYTGAPILRGAYVSLRAGRPNMDLLVALAASTAYVYSTAAALSGHVEVYFDVTVVVVMAVSLGSYYERRLRERATDRLADLASERVTEATVRTADGTEPVPVGDLSPDDEVVVRRGDRVPVDGTVRAGTAAVDSAVVTGESVPERVTEGDRVVGGAVVADGRLVVAPDPDGGNTVDRLLAHLWEVRSTRPGAQRLADRLAAVFVPLVLLLATGAGLAHLLLGAEPTAALLTGLAVLVVSCPCALGLATPLASAAGIRDALRRGIVVTSPDLFERAADADVVVLDKTGTLSTAEMAVVDSQGDSDGFERAAAIEQYADHPVAGAVVDHVAADPDLTASDRRVDRFETHPGLGVSADVDGQRTYVGRPELLESNDVPVPSELATAAANASDRGQIPILVGWGGRARSLLLAGDDPRAEWSATVSDLAADRRVVVLTGDRRGATEWVGDHPDVDEVFAGVPPEGKAAVVERLRGAETVAMVGDGSNDAPALGAADVAIAMGGGTALASDAADAVVVDDDLSSVPTVFDLTAATKRRIRTNLGWAFLYNAVALPVAALGLLNPLVAAVAMAASSVLVVTNSARDLVS